MKICTVLLHAWVMLIAASLAHAATNCEVALLTGASLPSSAFGDAAKTGFNLGGQYQFLRGPLGFGGEISCHRWGATSARNRAAETQFGTTSEYRYGAWQYNAYGIAGLPLGAVMPYLKLGAGYYAPNTTLQKPSGDVHQYDISFGTHVGLGLDVGSPGNIKLGLVATYHQIKDTERDFVTLTARLAYPLGVMPPR